MSRSSLALTGGAAAVTLQPQPWPQVSEEDVARMEAVVRSGKWSWLGEHELAFCDEFARFIGSKHAMCLANGTVTLQCALQAVGVEPGVEVIVPGLTWVATAQAALDIGANVVLVDIDPETYTLDPEAVAAAITPRTRAIIPVHIYGCMCDMDALMDLARKHGLKVVERDVGAGAIGDAGSFSFQQSKVLTSGEGGAITCDDDEVYETAFCLKQVGWTPPPEVKPGNRYGHNYRITELQAVLLRGGVSRLEAQTAQREASVALLRKGLEDLGGPLRLARRDPRVTRQAYYGATLHFEAEQAKGVTRAQYVAALAAEGLGLAEFYEPVYRHPLLNLYDRTSPVPYRDAGTVQDYANLRLPVCERAKDETALVLMHTHLLAEADYIGQLLDAVEKVNEGLEAVRGHFARQE